MTISIGQTIKKLRKERNLTQEELAEQLNVTSQAVSKWENETGLPDISQIIPLASVFGVSTDILFGIEGTSADEEALKIVQDAHAMQEYGKPDTYLNSYDMMMEGLKKYPSNLMLLYNCMRLGLMLSLPENGDYYVSGRAEEISAEVIRQANLVISYSKNISDIMDAHQTLVMLYSSEGRFEEAASQALNFPVRTDFTLYSNMARVNGCMGNYSREIICLCSDIDYSLQALGDNTIRLGKAYYNSGQYKDAIAVYETFFEIMKAIFKDDCPPPYHDFDSEDCYILLAQAYLAVGDISQAMDSVENAVMYYVNLSEICEDGKIAHQMLMKSSLVKGTEVTGDINKSVFNDKLRAKMSAEEINPLKENKRFKELYERLDVLHR